ncbi:MAG: hypothetical protein ACRDJM_06720 [Actinomycetota bacterium]
MTTKPKVRTVFLGQFSPEHAEAIAKELEEAGITWWHKQAGSIAQFFFRGDWGVRLFVDAARTDEVKAVVQRVRDRLGSA